MYNYLNPQECPPSDHIGLDQKSNESHRLSTPTRIVNKTTFYSHHWKVHVVSSILSASRCLLVIYTHRWATVTLEVATSCESAQVVLHH